MGLRLDPVRDFLLGKSKKKRKMFKKVIFCFTWHVLICWFWVSKGISNKGFQTPWFWKTTSMAMKVSVTLEELIGEDQSLDRGPPPTPLSLFLGGSVFRWTPPPHHPGRVTKPMAVGLDHGSWQPDKSLAQAACTPTHPTGGERTE